MPSLQIVSSTPVSGKTTIASGLAQGIARAASRIRLERLGTGEAAQADAATFASYLFASSSGRPLQEPPVTQDNETMILELDGGAQPLQDIPALLILRSAPSPEDKALAQALRERLLGTIAIGVEAESLDAVAHELTDDGLRPLALLPELRSLTAPSVAEITAALEATILYPGEDAQDEVVEDIIVAPVFADPASSHFRRFTSKAILAPFNKTDLHLAAIEARAACLIVTGGINPSPYVIDRVQRETTALLLSPRDTLGTVAALGDMWSSTRFRGEAKAAAINELLASRIDFSAFARKLEA